MKNITLSLLVIFTLCIFSCDSSDTKTTATIDGNWESVGYGRVAQIVNGEFILADVTDISCVQVLEGNVSYFADNLSVNNDTLSLKDGINTYYFTRLDQAPNICKEDITETKEKDPIYNFEVLAHTFKEHYAYFELRQVNWDSLYKATKQKISNETSEAELFIIMEDMLDSFNDGHIGLDASEDVEDAAELLREIKSDTPDTGDEKRYGDMEIADLLAANHLKDNMKSSIGKTIHWGRLENNMGYLQINIMFGHADLKLPDSLSGNAYWQSYFGKLEDMSSEAHTKLEVEGLNNTLDLVMTDLSNTDAMILDVRFNGGGKDEVALEIMKRFNAKKQVVFNKKAKTEEGYTKPNHIVLEASENAYTKPLYILTSQHSASATEIMVLSSLLLEHATRIGAHTEGVFSDVLDKELPNGWVVGLSNEVYIDTKGVNYEGKGISPDINLNYPGEENGQVFFRSLANDLEADKNTILNTIAKHQ